MKKTLAYILIITLLLSFFPPLTSTISAQSIEELEKELAELEEERNTIKDESGNITAESEEAQERMDEIEREQERVSSEINQLNDNLEVTQSDLNDKQSEIETTNQEITSTEASIETKEAEIEETEAEIVILAEEIDSLVERIADREELLKKRLRSIQHSGGNASYLEVLMGAQSFTDFINRFASVTRIMDQDKGIMESQKTDKLDLEIKIVSVEEKQEKLTADKVDLDEEKEKLEQRRGNLVAKHSELANLQAKLNSQINQQETLAGELEDEHNHLEDYDMSLEEQNQTLLDQQAVIDMIMKEVEANKDSEEERIEQERLEQEKIKQERLEQERIEQLARENADSASNSSDSIDPVPSDSSGDTGSDNSTVGNSSSSLIWPAVGRLSSGHGWRNFNGGSFHNGIDIANIQGTPIYAAASGVVTRANYSASYGNVIYIYHRELNLTTVYAHLHTMSVSLNSSVSQGQQIGGMGNTGNSFGDHLHFEVHNGLWSQGNGIDPMPFLP